jgi:hypothetical protein
LGPALSGFTFAGYSEAKVRALRPMTHSSAHRLCALTPDPARSAPAGVIFCFRAAFALGGTSRSACPTSYVRLATADACTSAAAVAGTAYGGSGVYSCYPAGCFWHTITDSVYYNAHPTGAANYYAQPLCAGAAPIPRTHADAHTHVFVRL